MAHGYRYILLLCCSSSITQPLHLIDSWKVELGREATCKCLLGHNNKGGSIKSAHHATVI